MENGKWKMENGKWGRNAPFFCVRRDVGTHHGASARHIRNNFAENANFRQKVFVISK